jgi:hypothetical protein
VVEVLIGSSCNAVCSDPVCRTTGCSVCVLPVLFHICATSLDLLPVQKVALLSPGESSTLLHFDVLEVHRTSETCLSFAQFINLCVLVSLI